jgi:signal transduction histidine kinase
VQVLVNLLSNAIKHSPEGGAIQIDQTVSGDRLRVEVRDEGKGVTVEQRSNLFRRFAHMEPSSERARHGAGLGLSVVKAIVEAQRGEVGISNLTEGGTAFWFTVPLMQGAEQ